MSEHTTEIDAPCPVDPYGRPCTSNRHACCQIVCGHPSGEVMFGRCIACGTRVTPPCETAEEWTP